MLALFAIAACALASVRWSRVLSHLVVVPVLRLDVATLLLALLMPALNGDRASATSLDSSVGLAAVSVAPSGSYGYDSRLSATPPLLPDADRTLVRQVRETPNARLNARTFGYDAPHLLRPMLDGEATKPAGALVEEGTYVVKTAQGEYVGQSGAISRRLQQHVASGKFTQAEVDAAERAMVTGGKLQREIAEQLLIDSKGGIDGLLNKVNPIGPKRVPVMPNQPYKR